VFRRLARALRPKRLVPASSRAVCPGCKTEVKEPVRKWYLAPRGRVGVWMGLYHCPYCGRYFRAKVE